MKDETVIEMRTMMADDEGMYLDPFNVSDCLQATLTDQGSKLGLVDSNLPRKQRYLAARAAGCFAAIAKGAKDRELKGGQIFIPRSELSVIGNTLRISSLKATISMGVEDVAAGAVVKNVTFTNDGTIWYGVIEMAPAK